MRLALFLRHRHSLLMQSEPTRAFSTTKRPLAKHALAHAPPPKLPRTATPQGQPATFSSSTMASNPPPRKRPHRSADPGPSSAPRGPPPRSRLGPSRKRPPPPPKVHRNLLEGPLHTEQYIQEQHAKGLSPLERSVTSGPRGYLNNFYNTAKGEQPFYDTIEGTVIEGERPKTVFRTTVKLDVGQPIVGIADHAEKRQSQNLAALSACYQLHRQNILYTPKKLNVKPPAAVVPTEVTLSDGTVVTYEQARSFMDYYCRRYKFPFPEINYSLNSAGQWEVIMTVNGRRIGLGAGPNKKAAQTSCYLDVTKYLESCDPELWQAYRAAAKTGADLGLAPSVYFQASRRLEDEIGDLVDDIRHLTLYKNRPQKDAIHASDPSASQQRSRPVPHYAAAQQATTIATKSNVLLRRRQAYLQDPKHAKMRETRQALPVSTQSKDVLEMIAQNDVTICMAATGSGKTTQIPQMILDDYIERGEGAKCNVICTQPRRLAAISVATRVAQERGESLGQSIGYHVRFESRSPDPNGSVTFCTIGVFLKQLQSGLSSGGRNTELLDKTTHIIVDEVHERDVDTDLLLVVLKQLLAYKKSKQQALKIVLMSATIDPELFMNYFPDSDGQPAKVIDIPGRSFPVTKHFMEEYVPKIISPSTRWILDQENVQKYLHKELGPDMAMRLGVPVPRSATKNDEDMELPYALIAATIAHVCQISEEGHVLVFLPGWQDISNLQKMLLGPQGPLGIDFNSKKYTLHLLHSSIPLAEQQVVFEPTAPGVRRIILATNIAETSITIPNVVYVVDTVKVKEDRYDPDRKMSSLVSAWVGASNLNQRAGRAGRHRSGEYFGIISEARANQLPASQMVEMKRVDLSNIVMHVKALNFTGMTVEEVLAAAIEPPAPERVHAAMKDLQMVGALDSEKNLTSLGRVLLQLPVDVQMGRLVLYGSFFRCLDNALALAAILSNRDPFMAPMHIKAIAQAKKDSWTPEGFRSDALATLKAFNAWWVLQSRNDFHAANRFCVENFLSKPTLLLIQKTKVHLLQSLYRAGVIEVSAGGQFARDSNSRRDFDTPRSLSVPPELNANSESLPLLTALITIACQPKFGIRTGERAYRTMQDKNCLIHPSSVNNRKHAVNVTTAPSPEKQLYAFTEKRRNETPGSGGTTYLVTTTRVDPLTYMLFGAYNIEVVDRGLECDNWLPITGDIRTLDEVQRLKTSIEACMLRVFEGIHLSRQRPGVAAVLPREEREDESEDEDEDVTNYYRLSSEEIKDLDILTRDVVGILNRYSDERIASQSAVQSRAATPVNSPFGSTARLPSVMGGGGSVSGYSTPSAFQSRPGTPSRFQRRF